MKLRPNPEFTGAHLWASACNVVLGLVADAQGLAEHTKPGDSRAL